MYIFSEILLLIIILIDIFNFNNYILNVIKFIPIFINFIISLNKKININLRLGIICTLIADFFFLIIDYHLYGVLFFLTCQLYYYLYLKKSNNIIIYLLIIINILFMIIFKNMMVEGILYVFIEIINIYSAHKLSKKNKRINNFKYGLILLLLCDLTIVVRQVFNLNNYGNLLLDALEWICYIPSGILIVLYIIKSKDK